MWDAGQWNLHLPLVELLHSRVQNKVPPPPCRWSLPSGSAAFPPLVLLRTCFMGFNERR
jgi:hypothetical protein